MTADPLPAYQCCRQAGGNSIAWDEVEPILLRDLQSGDAPRQKTSVQAAWTADRLHLRFVCDDTLVQATLTERDAPLYTEEVVEVFIDPTGDGESYYEIEVNPLNAVLDLVLRRNRSGWARNFAWDCEGFESRAEKTKSGWQVEMSIPFRSLVPDPPQAGSNWRINFCRIDRRSEGERELSAWSTTGGDTFHVPERFGVIEFAA